MVVNIEQLGNSYYYLPTLVASSVADPGCLSRNLDPNFSIPDPGSKRFRIPDPHHRIQVALKLFLNSRKRKNDLGCSWIQILFPSRIPNPGLKKNTGSRIRNTGRFFGRQLFFIQQKLGKTTQYKNRLVLGAFLTKTRHNGLTSSLISWCSGWSLCFSSLICKSCSSRMQLTLTYL
jgi:hypothetical protein